MEAIQQVPAIVHILTILMLSWYMGAITAHTTTYWFLCKVVPAMCIIGQVYLLLTNAGYTIVPIQ